MAQPHKTSGAALNALSVQHPRFEKHATILNLNTAPASPYALKLWDLNTANKTPKTTSKNTAKQSGRYPLPEIQP